MRGIIVRPGGDLRQKTRRRHKPKSQKRLLRHSVKSHHGQVGACLQANIRRQGGSYSHQALAMQQADMFVLAHALRLTKLAFTAIKSLMTTT